MYKKFDLTKERNAYERKALHAAQLVEIKEYHHIQFWELCGNTGFPRFLHMVG